MAELQQVQRQIDLLTAALVEVIGQAWADLTTAEQALIRDWPTLRSSEQHRRQQQLIRLARDLMSQVNDATRQLLPGVLEGAFESGAAATSAVIGTRERLSAVDSDVARAISIDTYLDLLNATRYVETTTKELVRVLARHATTTRVTGGVTAEQAGRALARQLEGYGISAIVYRNGARHGLDDYGEMLLRTKTAEIYQIGGFAQAREHGVRFMELLDSPSCGLSFHNDPILANGLILPISEAEKYPISHPRCVRVSVARVDLLTPQDARDANGSTTAAQNADQRLVEQQRQSAAARRAQSRLLRDRTVRTRTGLLVPAAGAATSPAARRAAARVARTVSGTGGAPSRAAARGVDTEAARAARTLLASAQAAEPRLTALMTDLATRHGGTLASLEFRVKDLGSLTRKIDQDMALFGHSGSEVASSLFDVNRYTLVFSDASYARDAQAAIDGLRADGYELRVKNFWADTTSPYQGINLQITGPDGARFELQLHTAASVEVKETELHPLYELARKTTDPARREIYRQTAKERAAKIPVPSGAARVS